jgi:hypothetical protein
MGRRQQRNSEKQGIRISSVCVIRALEKKNIIFVLYCKLARFRGLGERPQGTHLLGWNNYLMKRTCQLARYAPARPIILVK